MQLRTNSVANQLAHHSVAQRGHMVLDSVANVAHAVAAHGLFDAFVQRRFGFPQQHQHFRRHLPDWVGVGTI